MITQLLHFVTFRRIYLQGGNILFISMSSLLYHELNKRIAQKKNQQLHLQRKITIRQSRPLHCWRWCMNNEHERLIFLTCSWLIAIPSAWLFPLPWQWSLTVSPSLILPFGVATQIFTSVDGSETEEMNPKWTLMLKKAYVMAISTPALRPWAWISSSCEPLRTLCHPDETSVSLYGSCRRNTVTFFTATAEIWGRGTAVNKNHTRPF